MNTERGTSFAHLSPQGSRADGNVQSAMDVTLPEVHDVERERNLFLNRLLNRVDEAFTHRTHATYLPDQGVFADTLQTITDVHAAFEETSPDEFIEIPPFSEEPGEVAVTNPYDYKDLLLFATEKLTQELGWDPEAAQEFARATLAHELEHHVPLLEIPDLHLYFTIRFVEDKAYNVIGLQPALMFDGQIKRSDYLASINAVETLSPYDTFVNEEHKEKETRPDSS